MQITDIKSVSKTKFKVYLDGTGVPKWELSWGNTFRTSGGTCGLIR